MVKAILSWLVILLVVTFCIWQTCFAEVFIVINKTTKAIITMGEKNDNVLSANQELITLPGTFENYDLKENPTNYFYKNNKFVLNTKKINDEEVAKQKAEKRQQEEALVNKEMRNQAITALEIKGIVFTELKEE